jgi:HAD superfamily hydrolase (TIGR01549 family)
MARQDWPAGVLLDMDGTLTRPILDFDAIKRDMQIDGPILETLATLAGDRRRAAEEALHRHEMAGAEGGRVADGAVALLAWLRGRRLPHAIVTRNSKPATAATLARHKLRVPVVVTRDCAPHKPDPAPLHHAAEKLGVAAENCWMVGDGEYDVQAGHAAGCRTVWVSLGRERDFEPAPDAVAHDLPAVQALLANAADGCLES